MASRIDFALVSQGLTSAILNTCYLPGIMTDHLAFFLAVDQLHCERGRGYWKFNTQYLQDNARSQIWYRTAVDYTQG